LEPDATTAGQSPNTSSFEAADDDTLVALARDDLEAFGELVRRHQDFVYGAALRVTRNPTLAQDVAQEAFVRAHRGLADFQGRSQFRSWLYRIATNLALNAVQRRREYPTERMPERPTPSGPERQTEVDALRDALEEAIAALPEDLRVPLVMREFGGLSYAEIADETGLVLNTVRTRILRARRALRSSLEAWR
jgi:RNA polymerase sigma-70 factor (ECF subfamily)